MATYNKFNCFVEDVAEKVHNLGSDTLKLLLTNTSPNAADTDYNETTNVLDSTSSAAEISAGNGYTEGGETVTISASSQTGGTYKLVGTDTVVTASGGSIGPFRYVVLYNSTGGATTTRPLIGWWDYGSSITLNNGETLTVDFDGTNGILQIA